MDAHVSLFIVAKPALPRLGFVASQLGPGLPSCRVLGLFHVRGDDVGTFTYRTSSLAATLRVFERAISRSIRIPRVC